MASQIESLGKDIRKGEAKLEASTLFPCNIAPQTGALFSLKYPLKTSYTCY